MSECRKCGNPIAFKRLASGKLCPTNPDGSDHWDLCKGIDRTFESAVSCAVREGFPHTHKQGQRSVYTGDIPPWDEALGDYREFTREEIEAGVICRRLTANDRKPGRWTEAQQAERWASHAQR